MQVNWTRITKVTHFQSLTFCQIDHIVVILSIVKSKLNKMNILNFGSHWKITKEFLTPGLPKNCWMTMKLSKQLTLSKKSLMRDNEGYCFKFKLFRRFQNLHVFVLLFF